MFSLNLKKVERNPFGKGAIYAALISPVYAPLDGRVERHDTDEGGITILFFQIMGDARL